MRACRCDLGQQSTFLISTAWNLGDKERIIFVRQPQAQANCQENCSRKCRCLEHFLQLLRCTLLQERLVSGSYFFFHRKKGHKNLKLVFVPLHQLPPLLWSVYVDWRNGEETACHPFGRRQIRNRYISLHISKYFITKIIIYACSIHEQVVSKLCDVLCFTRGIHVLCRISWSVTIASVCFGHCVTRKTKWWNHGGKSGKLPIPCTGM